MSSLDETVTRVAWELDKLSPTVTREFRIAAVGAGRRLGEEDFACWAAEGLAIAGCSYRAWESAADYFRMSLLMLESLSFPHFLEWARAGQELATTAPALASAYFRASPEVVALLRPEDLAIWARQGRGLYQDTWKAKALCSQFYEVSPRLLRVLTVGELERFIEFLNTMAQNAPDLARECLESGDQVLGQLEHHERDAFLALASVIARRNWRAARTMFHSGPRVLATVERGQRRAYLALTERFVPISRDRAVSFFVESAEPFREIARPLHGQVLALAEELFDASPDAAVELVRVANAALQRVDIAEFGEWTREGLGALGTNYEAGLSYLRLESQRGQMALDRLSRGVALHEVRETLRMYCKALTGRSVGITATEELAEKNLGWTTLEKATTEGSAIYLPSYVKTFRTKAENRAAYKVLATHQAGHLEFGSFDFRFDRPATVFEDWRPLLRVASGRARPAVVEFDALFDVFPVRELAKHIFVTAEDARIDHHVKADYRGISRSYGQVQSSALESRPDPRRLPLRQGMLELTIRLALGQKVAFPVPAALTPHFRAIAAVLRRLCVSGTTVEDTAEATARLYAILAPIPNLSPDALPDLDWRELSAEEAPGLDAFAALDDLLRTALAAGRDPFDLDLGRDIEELPYEPPAEVVHWGDFKPEIVQALMRIRRDAEWRDDLLASPLTADELRALLECCAELDIKQIGEDELDESTGLFVTNLLNEGLKAAAKKKRKKGAGKKEPVELTGEQMRVTEAETFTYDEWDYRADDYKPDWCLVAQRPLEEGSVAFFEDTLREYSFLVQEIKRQFELLRPELFRKLKRLRDGEEFDLDAVIEAVVEKKAGVTPSEKLYYRRNKVERSVSVVFLLDMSASTDEEIKGDEKPKPVLTAEEIDQINRKGGWELLEETIPKRGKRIIDLEKESLVLLIKALETIGDTYGIYGFSGHGRDNVEFYVVKDLEEAFDDRVKRRIDRISPIRATRMGPAIRHATTKLEERQAKVRLLILISDGRPQDHDYGKDRTEKEYGIHDTKMALLEARRKGIVPFCLTVDKQGHDYLGAMCGDLGYEVVGDIEALPKRLPSLYRKLTS